MALYAFPSVTATPAPAMCSWKTSVRGKPPSSKYHSPSFRMRGTGRGSVFGVTAFFPNPTQQPILKDALKEPVAFVGGLFAGLLRLDLNEEPLREWVARTVEASGITKEELSKREGEEEEQVAQQIEIE